MYNMGKEKHLIWVSLLLLAILTLSGCGTTGSTEKETGETQAVEKDVVQEETAGEEATEAEDEAEVEVVTMDGAALEALLKELPLAVASTEYVVQDEEFKSLYPDMLQAVLVNQTTTDIKNVVVAFVAWDENQLPVKLKSNIDFSDGVYVKEVAYNDVNMVPDSTFGEESGYAIDSLVNVKTFKAIPVSFTTFEGDSWENPYYENWKALYEDKKFNEAATVDVTVTEAGFEASEVTEASADDVGAIDEVLSQIEAQAVKVIGTEYLIQDATYKSLYPDMLSATIQNGSESDIRNAVIAFVAWDENNLPVKIKGDIDLSTGDYVKLVSYNDINLVPGKTYGESSGFSLSTTCSVETFKAIVVSYEPFEGEMWENPLFDKWKTHYGGQKLK